METVPRQGPFCRFAHVVQTRSVWRADSSEGWTVQNSIAAAQLSWVDDRTLNQWCNEPMELSLSSWHHWTIVHWNETIVSGNEYVASKTTTIYNDWIVPSWVSSDSINFIIMIHTETHGCQNHITQAHWLNLKTWCAVSLRRWLNDSSRVSKGNPYLPEWFHDPKILAVRLDRMKYAACWSWSATIKRKLQHRGILWVNCCVPRGHGVPQENSINLLATKSALKNNITYHRINSRHDA